MKQKIRDFKVIMADKQARKELKEFIGGYACVAVMLALSYIVLVAFC